MNLQERVTIQQFLEERDHLIGGTIIFWDKMFPDAPIRAEILAIEEVHYEGCDYRDIIVFTDNFTPLPTNPRNSLPKWRHFEFQINPLSASICPACHGMWVIAIPYRGVAHLYFHE